MSVALDLPPQQGEIVRVRSRRYLVEAVTPPPPGTSDQTLVRLSCLEDDAEGEPLEVLWEKEIDARRMNEADWSKLARGEFDPPRWFAAYYRTLRWNSVTSTDPKLFQAPYRAGIISIPEPGLKLRTAVEDVWAQFLQAVGAIGELAFALKMPQVKLALEGFSDDEVWAEVQRRLAGAVPVAKGIREAELETLLESPDEVGEDQPEGLFFARTASIPAGEPALMRFISKVVKLHRLREVIVQVGFTRFESAVPDINGELDLNVERAALSLNQPWLPAVENRGEGIFIGFKKEAVEEWSARDAVKARGDRLLAGFNAWRKDHPGTKAEFPKLPFVMLHTLSHLLITAVALDCGYAASSIRERIYVSPGGYGILLYTASPDAEGTLGGLVEAADRIDVHLRQAVEMGRLCSNDPLCAQHQPDDRQEDRLLSGAACHGCVLLAESSCERRNDFLDRALVVPTVDSDGAAFFDVDNA